MSLITSCGCLKNRVKTMKISKEDWRMFQELLPGWQENYMRELNQEYIKLLSRNQLASTNFWTLNKNRARNLLGPN